MIAIQLPANVTLLSLSLALSAVAILLEAKVKGRGHRVIVCQNHSLSTHAVWVSEKSPTIPKTHWRAFT